MSFHTNTYACAVDPQEMVSVIKMLSTFWNIVDDPWVLLPDEQCGLCGHKMNNDPTWPDRCPGFPCLPASGCAHSPATYDLAGIAAGRQQSSRQQSSRQAGSSVRVAK